MLKTPRVRDDKYLRHIAGPGKACECCGAVGTQAAHIHWGLAGGKGLKAPDDLVVSLCPACHADLDGSAKPAAQILAILLTPYLRRRYKKWRSEHT